MQMYADPLSVEAIFLEALEKPSPEERAAYLHEACGDDTQLRRRVERLLDAHPKVGSFLESPAPGLAATLDQPITEKPGTMIGPYKLLEQIGEGGMGLVFMARQQEPVKRNVALKVIKPGMDTRQVIARFEAERQALALMEHPNIARVLDAGSTDSGRPYFVMDLVKGIPVTEYCDRNRLSTRERLKLFVPICRAVQHAHQKGIIHRDLKPSNVLVTLRDGTAVPKIIDFGVAKATSGQLTDRSVVTGFAQMIGTPLYMSPEQAGLSGLDVDTRSDVYSLGVLLYELLTGTTPFEREKFSEVSFDELRRIIREEEPQRPSTRLSTLDAALDTVAENRHTDGHALRQEINGELDWIVMKALEKERNRRYETASALAADVQHYLADEPVEACPPSRAYRFRKFVRRNRAALAIAGVVVLSVVTVLVATTLVAIGQRELAQRRLAVHEGINSALTEVARVRGQAPAGATDPDEAFSQAREQLQRALALAESGPADADLVAQVQKLSDELGQEQRDRQLLAALDKAWLAQAKVNVKQSRRAPEACVPLVREALKAYGLKVGVGDPKDAAARIRERPEAIRQEVVAALYECYALALPPIGVGWRDADGRTLISRVSLESPAGRDGRLKEGDRLVGIGQGRKGPVADARGMKPAEIRKLLRGKPGTIVRLEVTPKGQSEPRLYEFHRDSTAAWLKAVVEAADADPWRRRVREAWELDDGKERRAALEKLAEGADIERQPVRVLTGLANRLAGLRQDHVLSWEGLPQGIAYGLDGMDPEMLDHTIKYLGRVQQKHPSDLMANCTLARMLTHTKPPQLEEAVRFYTAAVALRPESSALRVNLGSPLMRRGKLEEAIAEYREAIRLQPGYASAHSNLGSALKDQGKLEEAIAEFREAIRLQPDRAGAHLSLGGALATQGNRDEAIAEYREAIRLEPDFAAAHVNLGVTLGDQGKLDEAIAEFREAIRLEPDLALTHSNLGALLRDKGELEQAIAEFLEAIRLQPDYAPAHNNLGFALHSQGKLDEAIAEYREAIRLRPDLAMLHAQLGGVLLGQGKLEESLEEFAKAKEVEPLYDFALVRYAGALLLAGKTDEYRQLCVEAMKRFGSSSDGEERLCAARCCGLAPAALPDGVEAAEALKTAESGLAKCEPAGQEGSGWKIHTVGLAQLRAGQLDLAARRFRESIEAEPTWHAHFLNWLGLAVVHCRRGEMDEARGWFAKATEYAKKYPDKYTLYAEDWAEGELLRREVEKLLAAPQPRKDAAEPKQGRPADESGS